MTIPLKTLHLWVRKPTWRTSWRAWPSWSYVSGWGWPYRFWKHHGGRSFIAPYPCHSTLVVVVGCWCCWRWLGGLVDWGFSLVVGWLVGWLMVGWSGVWFLKMPGVEVDGWKWQGQMMRIGFCLLGVGCLWPGARGLMLRYYICSLPLNWSQLWKKWVE